MRIAGVRARSVAAMARQHPRTVMDPHRHPARVTKRTASPGRMIAAFVITAAVAAGCANSATPARAPSTHSVVQDSSGASATVPDTGLLRCPVTAPRLRPRPGSDGAPLPSNPTGALACLTNEPASKRAVIGSGTRLPASVAVVLARLVDQAAPASGATATKCAPASPLLLTRFSYRSGVMDVIESGPCPGGRVAYVHNRGYLLSPLLAGYLEGANNPGGSGLVPNVMGEPLVRAAAAAREAGDSLYLGGALLDDSAAGTVLLQYPTLDHQVEVIAAVHHSSPCRAGQLAVQYLAGAAGAGNDFGTILLRNVSASWCELDGPATITGLISGHPVTRTLRVPVSDSLELSPRATVAMAEHALPADQLTAATVLSAVYRDDPDGSLCEPHWVIPTTWQVVVGAETLSVDNGRATAKATPPGAGGLITCRGQFGASAIRTATS